jgi:hypothetical protein
MKRETPLAVLVVVGIVVGAVVQSPAPVAHAVPAPEVRIHSSNSGGPVVAALRSSVLRVSQGISPSATSWSGPGTAPTGSTD